MSRQPRVEASTLPSYLRVQPDELWLSIKVQPRASKNEIGEAAGNELKIKVTAAPVDAAANEALLGLLEETLNCPRNAIQLMRGHTSRHKLVFVRGISVAEAQARLLGSIA